MLMTLVICWARWGARSFDVMLLVSVPPRVVLCRPFNLHVQSCTIVSCAADLEMDLKFFTLL